VDDDWRVRVLDNFSTGTPANLASVADQVEVIGADVGNLELVRQATQGVELIFHLAAPKYSTWVGSLETNVLAHGTSNVLAAARASQARRIVFASSLCVYGLAESGWRSEGGSRKPASAYAVAKLLGELDCITFAHLYGLEAVCLRFAHVYGPRRPASSPYAETVGQVVRALRTAQPLVLRGDGHRPRDILFIDDAIRATLLAAESERLEYRDV
jgi:UDP-glucose 4-epimerase